MGSVGANEGVVSFWDVVSSSYMRRCIDDEEELALEGVRVGYDVAEAGGDALGGEDISYWQVD